MRVIDTRHRPLPHRRHLVRLRSRHGRCGLESTFWGIATNVLSAAWHRSPTDTELLPYWRLLIDHNRDRLADPANPDLIYAGQIFELPSPPPPP